MHVLLIESEPEDVIFLRDVLLEIEEGRHWRNWVNIEVLDARSWQEASAILAKEPVDIILLDIDTFHHAQSAAPEIPMILLIGPSDEALGLRLLRDGAQDYLVKKQIDCRPLAHAIENAIERHRLLTAARAVAAYDTLTGLPNRAGFLTAANRDRKLAERLERRLMLIVAEPRNLSEIAATFGEQRRDLALVEAADHLRSVAGAADLLARIDDTRFGMAVFDSEYASVEEAWARIHTALLEHRIQAGAAIFSADRPSTLEALLEQAAADLTPASIAMRT